MISDFSIRACIFLEFFRGLPHISELFAGYPNILPDSVPFPRTWYGPPFWAAWADFAGQPPIAPSPSSPRHRAGPGFLEGRIFHPMISRGKIPPECSVSGKKSPSTSPHCRNFRRISPPGAGFAQKNLECPCLGRINP